MNKELKTQTLASLRHRSVTPVKQSVIALEMSVQEPAISKLEQKRVLDTSLAKLQKYIAALGGSIEMTIRLPDGSALTLEDV